MQVARAQALDIVHAHYAIPHAAAAYLARQIIADSGRPAPAVVTTLHGTDITIVGSDPSYTETVAYCIEQSDAVTAVSESLKADTYRALGVTRDIEVIPNFLDCGRHARRAPGELREQLLQGADHLVVHMSNFRPVKRVDAVIEIFRHIRAEEAKARLLLVGDGPDVHLARERLSTAGLMGSAEFLGEQLDIVSVLVGGRSVPAALVAGELRPRGARGHGVRSARRRLARRRTAGSDRARADGAAVRPG